MGLRQALQERTQKGKQRIEDENAKWEAKRAEEARTAAAKLARDISNAIREACDEINATIDQCADAGLSCYEYYLKEEHFTFKDELYRAIHNRFRELDPKFHHDTVYMGVDQWDNIYSITFNWE